jgi:hypothetical protein
MLTRLSTVSLAAGAIVALGAAPALAGGPTCGMLCVVGGARHTYPGSPGSGGGNGGGGGGKAAPIPCPGAVNCNAIGAGPAAPAQAVPTQELVLLARAELEPPVPTIHTSPEGKTYVQLRTALWLNPDDYTRVTVSTPRIGDQVVTAIATPESVTWNMGEKSITCHPASGSDQKACSYTYHRSSADQPGGKYAISVTVTWRATWTCEGACQAAGGDFPEGPTVSRTANATLTVGEVQTESRPG